MYKIDEYSNMYEDINHHPDMMYELQMLDNNDNDNNNGFIYGVYWLDDNDNVCEVEWFKTEKDRFNEVNTTNERLRLAFYETN